MHHQPICFYNKNYTLNIKNNIFYKSKWITKNTN